MAEVRESMLHGDSMDEERPSMRDDGAWAYGPLLPPISRDTVPVLSKVYKK